MLINLFLSILSAVLLWVSFPPVDYSFLIWIALVPLFFALEFSSTKRSSFGWAYLTGFLFFVIALQWLHYVTGVGLVLLGLYLALYFGLFGLAYVYVKHRAMWFCILFLSSTWVILEWLRGWLLTGLNWGSLGHAQATNPWVVFLSSYTGFLGISFIVLGFNFVFFKLFIGFQKRNLKRKQIFTSILFLSLVGGLVLTSRYFSVISESPRVKVAVVQPNIPLSMTWRQSTKPVIVRKLLDLSRESLKEKPDLIIWPETSFPQFIWELPELFNEVKAFAYNYQVPILVGAVIQEGNDYYNAALFVSRSAQVESIYRKRHLVILGEYIPFRKQLPFLEKLVPIDDFSAGDKGVLFDLPHGIKFSVLICFEDTVPYLAREDVGRGADFLVNMTNDAWFKDSGQTRMHLYNAAFRSFEGGRPLIRATNTGESCLVKSVGGIDCLEDARGRRTGVSGVRVFEFSVGSGETFYTKYGDVFTIFCFLVILGLFIKGRIYYGGNIK